MFYISETIFQNEHGLLATATSVVALVISASTAWLTLFRRGTVKMTRPSVIFFGPDGPVNDRKPKVYIRTLLYATSKSGRIIESMYVSLRRNESKQNFSIWVYGDERLVRGSGLYVGECGVNTNHHFLAPRDMNHFSFLEGTYSIEVFAKLLGGKRTLLLFSEDLSISAAFASALDSSDRGLYFDWGPDAKSYTSHMDERKSSISPEELLKSFAPWQATSKQHTSETSVSLER